jgi:5-methylcytosine-specific restriction protein A
MPSRIPYHRGPGHVDPATHRRAYDKSRQADKDFYCSTPWLKIRALKLAEQPTCEQCRSEGRTTLAEHVHHVIDRKQAPALALDWDNLVAWCKSCHSRHHAGRKKDRPAR